MKDMSGLAKAAGISGSLKDTNELNGKTVSCMLKLNDNNYPEIDSKFGSHWQPAEGKKVEASAPAPAETVVKEDLGDKIPF